jgi:uncharacterized alkaline shock family protein YloU
MDDRLGTVKISPQVLATIARLTTLSVPGVVHMSRDLSSGMDRWLRGKGTADGVRVGVTDDAVTIDLAIVVAQDVNVLELGREIQSRVARAITEMVGMPVLAINVRVEDVERKVPEEPADSGDTR